MLPPPDVIKTLSFMHLKIKRCKCLANFHKASNCKGTITCYICSISDHKSTDCENKSLEV